MTQTRVAMIVGGGSGIGAACARRLADEGFAVAIMSSSGKGEALARELGGLGFTGSNLEPADLKRFTDMTLEKYGRIDAVVSSAGHGPKGAVLDIAFEPEEAFPTSGVFRAGLAAFSKLFADRYASDKIRMNNVLPGFIDSLPEKDDRRVRIPMGRYGRSDEVAELVAYLASDRSSYMTGQNLRIDGGITRSV